MKFFSKAPQFGSMTSFDFSFALPAAIAVAFPEPTDSLVTIAHNCLFYRTDSDPLSTSDCPEHSDDTIPDAISHHHTDKNTVVSSDPIHVKALKPSSIPIPTFHVPSTRRATFSMLIAPVPNDEIISVPTVAVSKIPVPTFHIPSVRTARFSVLSTSISSPTEQSKPESTIDSSTTTFDQVSLDHLYDEHDLFLPSTPSVYIPDIRRKLPPTAIPTPTFAKSIRKTPYSRRDASGYAFVPAVSRAATLPTTCGNHTSSCWSSNVSLGSNIVSQYSENQTHPTSMVPSEPSNYATASHQQHCNTTSSFSSSILARNHTADELDLFSHSTQSVCVNLPRFHLTYFWKNNVLHDRVAWHHKIVVQPRITAHLPLWLLDEPADATAHLTVWLVDELAEVAEATSKLVATLRQKSSFNRALLHI
ncbi:hypothetical protein FN846DRAFT_916903 [Sphaerosporella brunnea]|uniref:Uncharacterized protein n=1 Tax=Sphaerosporella brunnea TaxID=1250544 RepID=A0A5J5F5M0_9PEZI|nr:hypothetical protein FN846DRAFT_916903 [Sphaerosporella brunnea]